MSIEEKVLKLQEKFGCYLFNNHHHILSDYEFEKEGTPYVASLTLEAWFNNEVEKILNNEE